MVRAHVDCLAESASSWVRSLHRKSPTCCTPDTQSEVPPVKRARPYVRATREQPGIGEPGPFDYAVGVARICRGPRRGTVGPYVGFLSDRMPRLRGGFLNLIPGHGSLRSHRCGGAERHALPSLSGRAVRDSLALRCGSC